LSGCHYDGYGLPQTSETVPRFGALTLYKQTMTHGCCLRACAAAKPLFREVFYKEAVRVLQQVEEAVESARLAARGEIGVLRIGFLDSATASFLPGLIRLYRQRYPGVKLVLNELTPVQQDDAFARGEIDLGFTRPLSNEQAALLDSRTIYREPLLVAMPERMAPRKQTVDLKTLEQVPLVLFHRRGAPGLFDSITALCREAGFIPRVEHEPNLMQTALSLVASEGNDRPCLRAQSSRRWSCVPTY
jgi:DNA-binding transcriptional LysR family regulator